jgi:PBP1b-binding outer membrane lipoprotein LpoB
MSKNGMEQEENVMKKIIAILLSVMLLLGCVAAAEETGKTTIGTISWTPWSLSSHHGQ